MAKEINGEIVASSVEKLGSYTVFLMTARGRLQGNELFCTQGIVQIKGNAYKVMATGIGRDTRTDADVRSFIESLTIYE